MSWLTSIFSGGASDLVKSVGSLYTTDKDRLAAQAKIEEIFAKLETEVQSHLSQRHKTDMQSDSWLSKNIRPLALIHFVIVLDVIVVLAFCGLVIPAALLAVVSSTVQLILGFYFGGRTLEKGAKMLSGVFKK